MNNIVDLYNILLNEGLIKSIEENKAVELLNRNFDDIDVYASDDVEGGPSIIIKTQNYPSEYSGHDKDTHQRLLQFINNLGWFPSMIEIFDPTTYNKESYPYDAKYADRWFEIYDKLIYALLLEKKYDYVVYQLPKYLYHIAPEENISKILRIGLTPKTHVKLSTHPERIYLSFTIKGIDLLEPRFVQLTGKKYVRLKIDTSKWLKDTKLYNDPNFKNHGGYVLKNIPPNAITVIK